ncbi:hypothetical protein [Rhizobium halophytocola]|uniref:Lipoprotein n=1 Tax=Rhizobium halophytocola TaxID=735519 RepID=A0ABS4DW58_9HYPH|nr:hypothetical protein [Rhizobium halophytocola]MBP1849910.1 hypothetical protein [Rhizobium halophytocola]
MTPALHRIAIGLAAVCLVSGTLTGCKTAGELLAVNTAGKGKAAKTADAAVDGYSDPRVMVLSDDARIAGTNATIDTADDMPAGHPAGTGQATALNSAPADLGELTTQPTGVSAYQSSIFAAAPQPAIETPGGRETQASLMPVGMPHYGYNAASASLFSARRPVVAAAADTGAGMDDGL